VTSQGFLACVHCREELVVLSFGDESLDWCESCQCLEPDTVMVGEEEEGEVSDETVQDLP
jgi:hypothetical protein